MKLCECRNWDDFNKDGLLYFSQRLDEMLYHYSNHIYKVPLLNTELLVHEYLHVASLVKNGTIHEANLKHVMNEFTNSFENDVVIKKYIDEDYIKEILNRLNTSSNDNIEKTMTYLVSVLSEYNEWCKNYLLEIISEEKEKKKIEKITRSLVAGLIGAGYSHEYIYHYNRSFFYEGDIDCVESLDTFLNRFDYQLREYTVYVACLKKAEDYYDVLEKRLNVQVVEHPDALGLIYNTEKYNVVQLQVEALDDNKAANAALGMLNIFFNFYDLLTDNRQQWFVNKCKVVDEYENESFVMLEQNSFSYTTSHMYGALTDDVVSGLIFNATFSMETINRAVRTHNMALSERYLSNGFLNFWSVLEILFVSEQSDSKIKEIENKIIPILQNNYIKASFNELMIYISENIEEDEFTSFIDSIECENDGLWLQRIIILEEYKEKRQELNQLLKDYPLLRTRISSCHDIFSKRENILREIERFNQRIKWHLRRLYRTRNELIHSGEKVHNLKELGEHLHSYADACLLEIVFRLAEDDSMQSINNVIIDIQLKDNLLRKRLNKKGITTEEDIKYFFELT